MKEMILAYLLPCLWALIACVGFGLIFNIQGIGVLITGIGGGLGWLVYLLVMDWQEHDIFAAFAAAMSIAVYSEVMARVRRCPVTGYLQIALLPLVPGAGVDRAMSFCVEGATERFTATLLHTIGFAAALSVGAMLASSLFRALIPRFPRRKVS